MNISKTELRKQMRQQRNALTIEQQSLASQQLAQQIIASNILKGVDRFACYLANDGEIDPEALIKHAWQNNIAIYLPVLHPFATGHLAFFEYQAKTTMKLNKYNIAEPKLSCTHICPPAQLQLVFLPLVAFDKQGNRMGMGGGFYDRTFASNTQVKLVGLAHSCQQVEQLPIETWDVPLHAIVTPNSVITS